METKEVILKIFEKIQKEPTNLEYYRDSFALIRELINEDKESALKYSQILRKKINYAILNYDDNITELIELSQKTLLFESPHLFDSYLQYLELNRKANEKFYLPRRSRLFVIVNAMQDLADDKLDELFISMPPRVGKLLADDTKVLTPQGWKNHGDLIVGDEVYAPKGNAIKVIAVHPKYHTTHKVTMSDGSTFNCHFRHEWKVYDRRYNEIRTYETQDMIDHLTSGKKKRYIFQLLPKEILKGTKKELSVSPYVLGVWLGDGTNKSPRIANDKNDYAIIEEIKKYYDISSTAIHKTTGVYSFYFSKLRKDLQKLGLCYYNKRIEKFIPTEYLTASIEQRLELLAGLLDTDGCLRKKENRYDYTTSEEKLKDGVVSLISTFGWRVSVKECKPKVSSSGIVGKHRYWVVSFNPTLHIPCKLERKQLFIFSKQRKISIISIEKCEEKPGNCITVEGDGMYLVGNNLIPTHNTSIAMFFATWIIGRNSEASNLYSAFSDVITSAFYNGVIEIIGDEYTYRWKDVFPNSKIASTNAKDETLNIDRKKRYPSLTCRSLYGTLNGACDCNGILMSDDLIGGIEEALNKDRMVAAWSKVDNNLIPRAKENAKLIWIGTRWSMIDPAGLRMTLLENDEAYKTRRYKIINLPALDENEESNFEYNHNVGFSAEYYKQRRASFERNNDMASWFAQYMGEPIERDGALFSPEDLKYYNGILPEGEPDRIFMPCDPAWGGGDFVSAPVFVQYGDVCYIPSVVFDAGDKYITRPRVTKQILDYKVQASRFEKNNGGDDYKDWIEQELRKQNYRLNITSKMAITTKRKEQRIFDRSPEIRELYFLEAGKRSKDYVLFMQNLFSYKITGKNKNDDAPDSLAMGIEMKLDSAGSYQILKKPC